jgi:hypothetical protein
MDETKKQLKRSRDVTFGATDEEASSVPTSANPGQANTTQPDQGAEVPVVAKKRCVRKVGERRRGTAGNNAVQEAILEELREMRKESRPPSMTNRLLLAGAGALLSTGLTAAFNNVFF